MEDQMDSSRKIFSAVVCALAAGALLAGQNASADESPTVVAVVSTVEGPVEVNPGDAWRSVQADSPLPVRTQIRTGDGGKAVLVFANGAVVQVSAKTLLSIDSAKKRSLRLGLAKGRLNLWVKKKRRSDSMIVHTPAADIKDIGTDWGALYCQDDCGSYHDNSGKAPQNGLYVDVVSGKIVVANGQGSQTFAPGQFGFVNFNQPPVILPPGNGVPISTDKGINAPPQSVLSRASKTLSKGNQSASQTPALGGSSTTTPPPPSPQQNVNVSNQSSQTQVVSPSAP